MSDADGDADRPGTSELKWATIIGFGVPFTLGGFLGNILEAFGLATRGLQAGFWVQTYAYMIAAMHAAALLGGAYVLLGRGNTRAAGWLAILSGAAMAVLGVYYPVTAWWLAGPLAVVGGGRALLSARESRGEAPGAQA